MLWWWDVGDRMSAVGWIGMVLMVLFWIAVIVGIIYVVRSAVTRSSGSQDAGSAEWGSAGVQPTEPKQSDALRILEERYARGEIDREEFLQKRSDLLTP